MTSASLARSAPTATSDSSWQHVPALDGLRAAAVVAVLLFHAGHLRGGFLGVDLFFALSGFLITSLLIRDARGDGIRLTTFYGRRLRRLLPAVYTLIVVAAIWAWTFGSPTDLAGVQGDGPWAVAYIANWHFIAESGGYWASFAEPSMFDHLWSLAIEEQFYLLWPLSLLGVWAWARRPERTLLVVCVVGVVASFAAMLLLHGGGDPTRVYMGTDTRAASLLVGAAAATSPCRRLAAALVARLGRWTTALLAVLAALVLWSWVAVDGASSAGLYRGGLLLHSTACALVVAIVASAPGTAGMRLLGWGPLVWIGALSYGLYLWHWPVYLVLSPDRTNLDGVALTFVRIAVSVGCAALSYHLVENPIRYRVTWARGRQGLLVLASAVTIVAVALVTLPAPQTEIAAFDPASIATASPTTSSTATVTPATSEPKPPSATFPRTSSPAAPVVAAAAPAATTTPPPPPTEATTTTLPLPSISHAMWSGDSVAFDLSPAVQASLNAAGVAVNLDTAYPGFRIGDDPGKDTSLVTLVGEKLDAVGADLVIYQLSVWDSKLDPAEQVAGLTSFRDQVVGRGARLVFVTAPVVGDEATNQGLLTPNAVAQEMSAADPEQVLYLDATVVWGTEPVLDLDGDGTPERKRDHLHICPSGAARFAAWLAGELSTRFAAVTPASPTEWATGQWVTDGRYDDPAGACAPLG